jgi:hypothetical protein
MWNLTGFGTLSLIGFLAGAGLLCLAYRRRTVSPSPP